MKRQYCIVIMIVALSTCLAAAPRVIEIVPAYEDFRADDSDAFRDWFRSFVQIAEGDYGDNLNGNQDEMRPLWRKRMTPNQAVLIWYYGHLTDKKHTTMSYELWHAALPAKAKKFTKAGDDYWKQWWHEGFSPGFAWRNTDPSQTHTFSRPLLRGEKADD